MEEKILTVIFSVAIIYWGVILYPKFREQVIKMYKKTRKKERVK